MYGQDMTGGGGGRTDVPIKYFYFVSVELSLYAFPKMRCKDTKYICIKQHFKCFF